MLVYLHDDEEVMIIDGEEYGPNGKRLTPDPPEWLTGCGEFVD